MARTRAAQPGTQAPRGRQLDRDAFVGLYQDAYRTLWCVAAGVLGSRNAADDVVQDAAMTAMERLDQFELDSDFTAWMAQIVRFTALNRGRREQVRRAQSFESGGPEPTDEPASEASPVLSNGRLRRDQDAFDDVVVAALDTLDDTARACLLLRTVMDQPYRRIALTLGIPEGTAMSHVHRARARLRTALVEARGGVGAGARKEGDR